MNEIEAIKAAKEFDEVLLERKPFSVFSNLFDSYGNNCPYIFHKMIAYDMMLNADFLIQCNKAHLYAIYLSMPGMCESERIATRILLDKTIPLEIRAFFCREISYRKLTYETPAEKFFLEEISPLDFSRTGSIINRPNRDKLNEAINSDSISSFELNRQLLGIEIRKTLIEYLLMRNAPHIFSYLLSKYPQKFYSVRSKENWMFYILNNMQERRIFESTALHLLAEFEKNEPGIIARIRDPWNNTLLWYTPAYDKDIRKVLMDFGCCVEAKNAFGLSVKMLDENNADCYKREFVEKYGPV